MSILDQRLAIRQENILLGCILFGRIQAVPPNDLDEWLSNFRCLKSGMNYLVATGILGFFPLPFFIDTPLEQETKAGIDCIRNFYHGSVCWLHFFRTGMKPLWLDDPKRWQSLEKFATLAQKRYELVSEIFRIKPSYEECFGSPEFMWLLAEAAVCRQMLAESGLKYNSTCKYSGKRNYYDSTKRYIDYLSDLDDLSSWITVKDINQWFMNFDRAIEGQAFLLSEKDTGFEREYYKPYINARQSWNAEVYNNKKLQLLLLKGKKPKIVKR